MLRPEKTVSTSVRPDRNGCIISERHNSGKNKFRFSGINCTERIIQIGIYGGVDIWI